MNIIYRDLIKARVDSAIASSKALTKINHAGLKGLLREILIRDLLQPVIPPFAGIGQGILIDAYNTQSKQQDVVIYDRSIIPSMLLDRANGLIPIEAAIAAIEVKTEVNITAIETTQESASGLINLKHSGGVKNPEHVIPFLFGFSSDLTTGIEEELSRYKTKYSSSTGPAIRGICIIEKGYAWFNQNNGWKTVPADADHIEVITFLAQLFDLYGRVINTRGKPLLSGYLLVN